MKVDKSIRLDLSRIDVVDFLDELGLRNVEDKGTEVFYSCPFSGHKTDDVHPSASMRQGTTVAYCFGCGWRGNALKFLADYEGVSPLVAARWIRQRFGDDFQEPEGSLLEEIDGILQPKVAKESIINPPLDEEEATFREVDWTVAATFEDDIPQAISYMLDRGFSPEILNECQIGWDGISQRIIIPYRDEIGNLIGFKGRAVFDDQFPRYLVIGGSQYGFDPCNVSCVLWGLSRAILSDEYANRNHGIIVEGELNAMSMWQRGHRNAVGISGKFLSNAQVNLVLDHFASVTIIMDEVEDEFAAAEKLEPYMPVRIAAEHDLDPAEMRDDQIARLLLGSLSPALARIPD